MGIIGRTTAEAAHQKLGLVEKQFKPTSNARNESMFVEASAFSKQLRNLDKNLKYWHKIVDGGYEQMIGILKSPLPLIYEEGREGPVP
jgi:hypothetical protein